MIELLAAIPSIVYGFWGIIVLKPILLPFCNWITSLFEGKHWFLVDQAGKNQFFFPEHSFKGTPDGGGLLAAGIVLAIMIIPIITAITRDVLRVVPKDLEQGAIGLGATWWQATKVVLSFAKGGIFGAIALGLARAIGETMAVTMVLPMSDRLDFNIVGSGSTMASRLATSYGTPKSELMTESLTYLALILLGVTLIVNLLSRLLVRQFMKQGGGGKKK